MDALTARPGLALSRNIDDYPDGIIIPVDKPYRWTSADVIRKVKWAACRHFEKKNLKVGHAGTLDPLATGVLLVCIGKATKLAQELQSHPKEYLAGVVFGATTPSYDREKQIDAFCSLEGVSPEALQRVLPSFIGEQEQVAPLFSAKSVDGVRAYEMARREYKAAQASDGVFDHSEADLLSRQRIVISRMDLVRWSDCAEGPQIPADPLGRPNPKINVIETAFLALPRADILVGCSKGTYIRALARDLGEALGTGAFLDSLRRTRSGGFTVENSLNIAQALEILQ